MYNIQVFIPAIVGYVPSAMIQCITAFMDVFYIVRRNAIMYPALEHFKDCVQRFHELREIFVVTGLWATISLPCQHSLTHHLYGMQFFGAPNGLCSSITESKHIHAVKVPWQRSNRYKALHQMLQTITRSDKMAALAENLRDQGLLQGLTTSYMLSQMCSEMSDDEEVTLGWRNIVRDQDSSLNADDVEDDEDNEDTDEQPAPGVPNSKDNLFLQSDIKLAARARKFSTSN